MKVLGHPNFIVKSDLKVITDHVEKESEAKKQEMKLYLEAVRSMENISRDSLPCISPDLKTMRQTS